MQINNYEDKGRNSGNPTDCQRRYMHSPEWKKSSKNDYNSYMLMKRYKQTKGVPKLEHFHFQQQPQKTKFLKLVQFQDSSTAINQLIRQNEYLLDEIESQKQKIARYKETIGRLKRYKSQKCILTSENNITIVDEQNFKYSNTVESKLLKENTLDQSKSQRQKYLPKIKSERIRNLLDQSQTYIKHSKTSLCYEIQELNDKLCSLIEKSGFEKDHNKRRKNRLEMSNCVQELKSLRKHYSQIQ